MNTPSDEQRTERLTERYDGEARDYARYWAPVLHPASRRLVEAFAPEAARRIVDIGAGAGTLLTFLRARFPSALVVAVDRSEGMLELASSSSPVVVMDASRLAFASASFDLAIMSFMLFHLPDAVSGLADARRVLEPGGKVCVSTWASDIEARAVQIWNDELDAIRAPSVEELGRLANHDIMDTTDKVQGLLRAAGFVSPQTSYHDHAYEMNPEDFVALRTSVGATAERLRRLSDERRRRFLDRVQERLAALSKDDFTLRMRIILACAVAPSR